MAPNILFLMADQMQARVLDPEHVCATPCLDRLAAEGVRFPRAYTPNNICCPTRASIMTGLLPHNHGVLEVLYTNVTDLHVLREDKPHFAQRLRQAGYRTGYFGKWHVERTEEPQRFGWDVDGGTSSAVFHELVRETLGNQVQSEAKAIHGAESFAHEKECNPEVQLSEPAGYQPYQLCGVTDRPAGNRSMGFAATLALRFLEEAVQQEKPWCCFLSFEEPHDPYITERSFFERYDGQDLPPPPNAYDDLADRPGLYRRAQRIWSQLDEEQKRLARACYFGSITEIDGQFGRVLDFLERSGQRQNTVVILCADHGDLLGAHGLFYKDISVFEEVYRVPMIVSVPGGAGGAVCDARVGLHDLCPTLLELAGCESFAAADSRSFAQLLNDTDQVSDDWKRGYAEYYGNRWRLTQKVVWDGDWKFAFNGFDFDELYNLAEDPYELRNLAADPAHEEQVKKMTRLLWRYVRETGDTPLADLHYPALRLGVVGPLDESG